MTAYLYVSQSRDPVAQVNLSTGQVFPVMVQLPLYIPFDPTRPPIDAPKPRPR